MIIPTTTDKEYQITLKTTELEFIRNVLDGLAEFMEFLTGNFDASHTFEREYNGGKKGTSIDPVKLGNKIFEQYYNDDGELR